MGGNHLHKPPMLSISVRPERHSYHMIRETGEFVVNLTTESMAWATDYCGVRPGAIQISGKTRTDAGEGKLSMYR